MQLGKSIQESSVSQNRETNVRAIKAHFDGKSIKLPKEIRNVPPGEILLIVEEGQPEADDSSAWMKAQETAFAKVWENDEDAVYDSL